MYEIITPEIHTILIHVYRRFQYIREWIGNALHKQCIMNPYISTSVLYSCSSRAKFTAIFDRFIRVQIKNTISECLYDCIALT